MRYAINWQSPRTPKEGRRNNEWNIHTTDGSSFDYVCQAASISIETPAVLERGMLWVEGELIREGGQARFVGNGS